MKSKSELELYEFALLEISKKYRQNHPYKKHNKEERVLELTSYIDK